jgi:hypothetical protein
MCEGITAELEGIDLGDERLNKRSIKVTAALAANPEASINAAVESWSETFAAYRFFSNPRVQPEDILQPHRMATERRMREHPIVLIVQDTTEFDFSAHPPEGVRCLDATDRFGFYEHTSLAVTPDKLCLGVVGSEMFDRAPETIGQGRERKHFPIERKESFRWLTGYREACHLARTCSETQVIAVADAEADIYEIFAEIEQQTTSADFIIRARENRCTPQLDTAQEGRHFCKVHDQLAKADVVSRRLIDLPATPKRRARKAELEIRALSIALKPPDTRRSLPIVTLQFVLVTEVNGPGDGTDVSWLLMTTLPIGSEAEILRVIDYYVARWTVEIYFRALKTGCQVEKIQLETRQRVKNCLAIYKIIAWRIIYLTYLNRTTPEIPCTAVFEESEWKSVWQVVKKQPSPKTPPTLGEFMPLLTRLGGYNNRATELPPGPQVMWTALRRMLDFATAWLAFGPKAENPNCV